MFIGNDKEGVWVRAYGLAETERLMTLIEQLTRQQRFRVTSEEDATRTEVSKNKEGR